MSRLTMRLFPYWRCVYSFHLWPGRAGVGTFRCIASPFIAHLYANARYAPNTIDSVSLDEVMNGTL